MTNLEEYSQKYQTIRMIRRGGILQITFHTNGGILQWGSLPRREFPQAFSDIGNDPETKVIIMTGAGDAFSEVQQTSAPPPKETAQSWGKVYCEARLLLMNLLNIEVPMISVINGPAARHSELPLLCDIVLAAEGVVLQDSAHFINGITPGDGVQIVYPLLLGLNRGRYFLLTGQAISARQAQELGLVNEVLPKERLLARAWELAEGLARHSPLILRYSRILLTQRLKSEMHDLLGYGLALEGLGLMDTDR